MSKESLRAILINNRNALSEEIRCTFSQSICLHLFDQLPPKPIAIGSYIAHGAEASLEALHQLLFKSPHQLFVPRIRSSTEMEMSRLTSKSDLVKGRFKILTSKKLETCPFQLLDWIIMPCTGFDRRGHRLGMGGGFYDRALGEYSRKSPLKIGVGFNCQETDFKPDAWDVPVNWIVTETGFTPQL